MPTYRSNRFSVTVPSVGNAWAYIGIPYPTEVTSELINLGSASWPYDPCTLAAPDRPGTWTSNQTGFYYVKQGGTNAGNGYPTNPAGGLPTSPPAGALIVVEGTLALSSFNGNWTGTSVAPIFLVGNTGRATDKISMTSNYIQFSGAHLIIDGLSFFNAAASASDGVFGFEGSFQTIRNCAIYDLAGFRPGFGDLSHPGADHSMFYRVNIGPNGNWLEDTQGDNDYHGIKVFGDDHWFIECDFVQVQGDGIQISDEGGAATPNSARRIFCAGCTGTQFHQTMLWTKDATDVIFSGNVATDGFDGNNSSTNGAFGGQGDYRNLWIIGNTSRLNGEGVKLASTDTAASDAFVIGNLVYDQDPDNVPDAGGYENWGICTRNAGDTYVLFNTIHNTLAGISFNSGSAASNFCVGNFIDEPGTYDHLSTLSAVTNDYNYFRTATTASLTNASVNTHDIVGNTPGFTNEAGDDFSLAAGSALLDKVPDAQTQVAYVFNLFLSRYGIDIRKDILGNTRPSGSNHDIGAYERQ